MINIVVQTQDSVSLLDRRITVFVDNVMIVADVRREPFPDEGYPLATVVYAGYDVGADPTKMLEGFRQALLALEDQLSDVIVSLPYETLSISRLWDAALAEAYQSTFYDYEQGLTKRYALERTVLARHKEAQNGTT